MGRKGEKEGEERRVGDDKATNVTGGEIIYVFLNRNTVWKNGILFKKYLKYKFLRGKIYI